MSYYNNPVSIYDLLDALNVSRPEPRRAARPAPRPTPQEHRHHHHHHHQHPPKPRGPRVNREPTVDFLDQILNPLLGGQYVPQRAEYYPQEEYYRVRNEPNLFNFLNSLIGEKTSNEEPAEEEQEQEQEFESAEKEVQSEKTEHPDPPVEEPTLDSESVSESVSEPVLDSELEAATEEPPTSPSPKATVEYVQISKPETRLDYPYSPEANVYDTPETYEVILALPGASAKCFDIDFHPISHELTIKGEIKKTAPLLDQHLAVSEIKYGAFERSVKFPLIQRIFDEQIKAKYSNGLLQITIPKDKTPVKKAPRRKIQIEDVPDEELVFEGIQH